MKEASVLFTLIATANFQVYMISHLLGNPHGPSLSFSCFCGTADEVAAACAVEVAGSVVAGAAVPFAVVLSVTTAFFTPFCCPSSHGWALETAS